MKCMVQVKNVAAFHLLNNLASDVIVSCEYIVVGKFLWLPCVADADIIFLPCGFFMVALWNRADHYIFILSFVLSFRAGHIIFSSCHLFFFFCLFFLA